MKQDLSIARRIARAVFVGMGAISLLLILIPFAVDGDLRADLARINWSDQGFRAIAVGLITWIIIGLSFFGAALLIAKANTWGLLALTIANALLVGSMWHDFYGKDLVLIPPLGLSLIALLFEDCQILLKARKNPA